MALRDCSFVSDWARQVLRRSRGVLVSHDIREDEELATVRKGLLLLGWTIDARLTSDDARFVADVAQEALALKQKDALTQDETERLAQAAYSHMSPQVMSADARAFAVTGGYSRSPHLRGSVRLVDEAFLCFKSGYHVAAQAALYIVLETYLRSLAGWTPGSRRVTFPQLADALATLPASSSRDEASSILQAVYGWYDATDPPPFDFNRHGLIHGMRPGGDVDRLNCVRTFLLLDLCCDAEGVAGLVTEMDLLRQRLLLYEHGGRLPARDSELYASVVHSGNH